MSVREKDEALRIVFSGFNSDEIEEIVKSFSKIVPVKDYRIATDSVETVVTTVIVFIIGSITLEIAKGFFNAMSSDFYRIAKERFIRILKNKQDPAVVFKMFYKGTEISIVCRTNDERELNEVFDTIDKARDIAINELDKKETPKMRFVFVRYDKDWSLDRDIKE